MPSATLVRVGGLAAVLSGVLLVLGELLNLTLDFATDPVEAITSATFVIQSVVLMLAVALLLVGLVGLYTRVAEAVGGLGLVGFLVALVGTGMVMGVIWDQTFTVPAIAQAAPTLLETDPPALVNFGVIFSFALSTLGWLLFGIAAYRAQVLPSHSGHTPHGGRGAEQHSAALYCHRFRRSSGLARLCALDWSGSFNRAAGHAREVSIGEHVLAAVR